MRNDPSPSLRILHVVASMAPEAGGPPVVCAGLAAALAQRGHALTIATVHDAAQPDAIALPPKITLQSFPRSGSRRYMKSAALDRWLNANLQNFDIAHLHAVWQFPTFATARACRRHHVPYVTLLHGMLDDYSVHQRSYWLKRAYWLARERQIHAGAAAIQFLNAAEIRRAVPWIAGMPRFTLGNGISRAQLDSLPPPGQFRAAHPQLKGRPLALFLSRIHPKKGLDRLIPAWKALTARNPAATLLIAGAGDPAYLDHIQHLIATHQLQQNVLLLGQLIGPAKWPALVDADVFVLPSHQEGFSMAVLEALACGCPPVVTQECNFDELETIAPAGGIIIKNGDMPAFIAAAEKIFSNPQARSALSAAGRALVETHYTWEQIAATLETTYRQILGSANH